MNDSFPGYALLLDKYPYHAHVLARLSPLHDPTVGTMGVSADGRRFYLHLDLDYVAAHREFLLGLMLHEVHHIVLGHVTHPRFFGAAHPDLMALAMEMSANEYVAEPLPGRPVRWPQFTELGIREKQSTLQRYDRLVAGRLAGVLPPQLQVETADHHHLQGVGAAGDHPPGDGRHLSQLVHRGVAEARTEGSPTGRVAGRDPGDLLEELVGRPEPEAYLDWRAALQRFLARVRAPVHSYARPNRRLPHLVGVVPGRIWHPSHPGRPSLLAAVDTSASMGSDELAEIAAQLHILGGLTRITVVEFDAVIQRVYPFSGHLDSVAGGGGTDYRPLFDPDLLAEHHPDGIVVFSDGWGRWPDDDPRVPTLWALTNPGVFDCPWGAKAALDWSG